MEGTRAQVLCAVISCPAAQAPRKAAFSRSSPSSAAIFRFIVKRLPASPYGPLADRGREAFALPGRRPRINTIETGYCMESERCDMWQKMALKTANCFVLGKIGNGPASGGGSER